MEYKIFQKYIFVYCLELYLVFHIVLLYKNICFLIAIIFCHRQTDNPLDWKTKLTFSIRTLNFRNVRWKAGRLRTAVKIKQKRKSQTQSRVYKYNSGVAGSRPLCMWQLDSKAHASFIMQRRSGGHHAY